MARSRRKSTRKRALAALPKSTFTPHYEAFRETLVALRTAAGFSQRDLAKLLGRERSFVSRIEIGERRLDVVELHWILKALNARPAPILARLLRAFRSLDRRR
jgi:transcriptional regulator with XRE-family HTH domain